jgi:uncharacterized protein DUF1737
MMTYKLVLDTDGMKFMDLVNEHIKDGWEPLGGVAISKIYFEVPDQLEEYYCQAMIKR